MLKVVLDANQFVSGIISKKGASAKLLDAWRDLEYILITSDEILREVEKVLQYPHIMKKYNLCEEDVASLMALIRQEAVVLAGTTKLEVIKDDPDDNKILACAVKAEADYIVSGDKHLLKLGGYKNVIIVTVDDFLDILESDAER